MRAATDPPPTTSDRPTSYIRPFMFDGKRLDPDWWEDVAPSRAGLPPRYHDDDPRVVGAELGLLPEPRSPPEPPQAVDFAALANALRDASSGAPHVRLGEDRRGRRAMVFRFPFDELLNLAVKRLPGRRFDWETREWTVPCMEHTAPEVGEMLSCFPRVRVAPAVTQWLAQAAGWHGIAAVWDRGYGPRLALKHIAGTVPDWIEDARLEDEEPHGGWLLLPLDAETAAQARDQEGLEIDDIAHASIDALLDHRDPPPPAELDLVTDPDGNELFELWVGTRVDARLAFLRLSEAHRSTARYG